MSIPYFKPYLTILFFTLSVAHTFASNKINDADLPPTITHCGLEEYDVSISYNTGDLVFFNCSIWSANTTITAGAPSNPNSSSDWNHEFYCFEKDSCRPVNIDSCGEEIYDNTKTYIYGSKVYYKCIIWIADKAMAINEIPGLDVGWNFYSECNYGDQNDCYPKHCEVFDYNTNVVYKNANTQVYYNCAIWHNAYYLGANEPAPGEPGSENKWVYDFDCTDAAECADNSPSYCGVQIFNENVSYSSNTQVYYNCIIWYALYYVSADNNIPGAYPGWAYLSDCDDGDSNCPVYNMYCNIHEYSPTYTYHFPNSKVVYDCKIYKNLWWASPGIIPGEPGSDVWEYVEDCTEPECETAGLDDNSSSEEIILFSENKNLFYNFSALENTQTLLNFYDIKGALIFTKTLKNKEGTINTSQLQTGAYLIKIKNNKNTFVKRILIY